MRIYGTPFEDELHGTPRDDVIAGKYGDDYITADGGNDTVYGDQGLDTLYGGDGRDTVWGGFGGDFINGDIGNDKLHGGDADDVIFGGEGNDRSYGDKGNDYLEDGTGNNVMAGKDGDDYMLGKGTLFGDRGNDHLQTTSNDAGGGAGSHLYGGDGNDEIWAEGSVADGGRNEDHISITGWSGQVGEARGGLGADTFSMYLHGDVQAPPQHLVIDDFNVVEGDKLDIWGFAPDPAQPGGVLQVSQQTMADVYDQDAAGNKDGVIRPGDFSVGATEAGDIRLYFFHDSVDLAGVKELSVFDWIGG